MTGRSGMCQRIWWCEGRLVSDRRGHEPQHAGLELHAVLNGLRDIGARCGPSTISILDLCCSAMKPWHASMASPRRANPRKDPGNENLFQKPLIDGHLAGRPRACV